MRGLTSASTHRTMIPKYQNVQVIGLSLPKALNRRSRWARNDARVDVEMYGLTSYDLDYGSHLDASIAATCGSGEKTKRASGHEGKPPLSERDIVTSANTISTSVSSQVPTIIPSIFQSLQPSVTDAADPSKSRKGHKATAAIVSIDHCRTKRRPERPLISLPLHALEHRPSLNQGPEPDDFEPKRPVPVDRQST
ncbi:hypothetical protein CROQUDRAFT_92406 [Cronartium quercuum f. sp. fusiforme G11]|uniref:Uncharacterized protein n=1 Tax=Cronartium quercuum f. sp. fusiforme G11 TaxID=708437 RepID=A0A9P6NN82_9BASI|nr:hypothetical protein CROQUDRAFT_92406 [Cronartium quercuum f. sp. fusiforme G11]